MPNGKKSRARAAVERASKRGTQPAKRSGAKGRVAASLELNEATSRAFWNAALHREPPALRTSFGNYTCANIVSRFTISTSTTLDTLVVIPWSQSCLAAYSYTMNTTGAVAASAVTQYTYSAYASSTPLAVRPLRMSLQLRCTSSATTASGSVRLLSLDTSAAVLWSVGVARTDPTLLGSAAMTSFRDLVNNSPDTCETSAMALLEEHTYVSVPASYPAYNHYHDFVDFANTASSTTLQSGDIFDLVCRPRTSTEYLASTTVIDENSQGDVPPMRWFVLLIPPTPVQATYRLQLNRQDGCRYPANSLGACFQHESVGSNEDGESRLLRAIAVVSKRPSVAIPSATMQSIGDRISSVIAGVGAAAAGAVALAQRVAPTVQAAGKLLAL